MNGTSKPAARSRPTNNVRKANPSRGAARPAAAPAPWDAGWAARRPSPRASPRPPARLLHSPLPHLTAAVPLPPPSPLRPSPPRSNCCTRPTSGGATTPARWRRSWTCPRARRPAPLSPPPSSRSSPRSTARRAAAWTRRATCWPSFPPTPGAPRWWSSPRGPTGWPTTCAATPSLMARAGTTPLTWTATDTGPTTTTCSRVGWGRAGGLAAGGVVVGRLVLAGRQAEWCGCWLGQ